MPSGPELIIIVLAIVLLFGGAKIPTLMKGMGQGIREFRKEVRGIEEETSSGAQSKANREEP